MAGNFIQPGERLTLTAPYTVTSGSGALVGRIFGVALTDVTSGSSGEFMVDGVFDLAKATGIAWSVGDPIYWDDAAKNCTTKAVGGVLIGSCTKAALSGDTTGRVNIEPLYMRAGKTYVNTAASSAVTATTTETLFDANYTIPANTLKAGNKIRIRFQGIATATNSTDTLAVKLYLGCTNAAPPVGGITLLSLAATDVANNDVFQGEYELIVRTEGASGTVVGCGTYKSVPAAEGTMTIKDDILASTTLDTTAAQLVAVSATWSTNNAGNSCRLDVMVVSID